MLHPDFDQMAKAIGDVSGDRLRIIMGATTALQRLVRRASTFPEIVALKKHFPDGRESCGPRVEPEERSEYDRRRRTLFVAYLAGFNTLEEFKTLNLTASGTLALTHEEYDLASDKLAPLLHAELERVGHNLEALFKLRTLAEFYSKKCGFRNNHFSKALLEKILNAFMKALREAPSMAARIDIIEAMPQSRYDLFGSISYCPWNFVWKEAKRLEEGLLLEQIKVSSYIDKVELTLRLLELLENEMKPWDFSRRFAAALAFASRDAKQPDDLYTRALELTAEKAGSLEDLLQVIGKWQDRKLYRSDPSGRLRIPHSIEEKYDEFRLTEVERETDTAVLAETVRTGLYGSKSCQKASEKIEKHFQVRIATAQTLEDLATIEAEAKALSLGSHARTWQRARELEIAAAAQEAEANLATVVRGDIDDPTETLVNLYRYYVRMENHEKAKEVLFLLAPRFELEGVPS